MSMFVSWGCFFDPVLNVSKDVASKTDIGMYNKLAITPHELKGGGIIIPPVTRPEIAIND